jgi:hypothetical protein
VFGPFSCSILVLKLLKLASPRLARMLGDCSALATVATPPKSVFS